MEFVEFRRGVWGICSAGLRVCAQRSRSSDTIGRSSERQAPSTTSALVPGRRGAAGFLGVRLGI